MDLGIKGRTALVCGSSQGLGLACAEALAREGVHVVINGRDAAKLDTAARNLRARTDTSVTPVAADLATEEGRSALLAAAPACDILINNNGGPKPAYFSDMDHNRWLDVIEANMVAPMLLTQGVLPGMKERRFGRIINITSAMVTTPRPHMAPSAAARAGLTGAMKTLALDVARFNITINNMLPERFDTDRQHQMAKAAMARENITYDMARKAQVESIAAKRLGDPQEFGATCAFLCSAFAGFMSGQNLHLDGGSYPALV